jgi:hypothetical protein
MEPTAARVAGNHELAAPALAAHARDLVVLPARCILGRL